MSVRGEDLTGRGPRRGLRRERGSRLAGLAALVVLLGVSCFAVWSSQATARAAQLSAVASRLSDDYVDAASAVAAEESLERKYRVQPGMDTRVRHADAGMRLVAAVQRAATDGEGQDRATAQDVLVRHVAYLNAMQRLFSAVDAGNTERVVQIDADEVDPLFGNLASTVDEMAGAQHRRALAQLDHLQRLERLTGRLTPVVFVAGLGLLALLASVTRGYRRLIDAQRDEAVHASLHDGLTGLPNRELLGDRLDQALRAGLRDGSATGLLLLDLDRFKDVNDTFGHHYGDALLAQVGRRLAAVLRDSDTVARLGGDEFAVVLPQVRDLPAAMGMAASLRAVLDRPFDVDGVALDIDVSIGVVLSGEHGDDPATLLQRADVAMYVAKAQQLGVVPYDPAADGHSPARLALLGDLRRALELHQLVLHYQPKVSISTGDVVGAEALVRWEHPGRGLVHPDAFIPLAEQTGLIGPLTGYVLDAALAQARVWADAGAPLAVSVNLSARNLLDEALPQQVADLLDRHGVPASRLELEVTESALMTEPARALRLLEQLDGLGVRLSIDDFGAGYTSLGQLKDLPVRELKIDKSFVLTMTDDISNGLIVHSVVDLGHNLGLTIVAEGVETSEALRQLSGYGCDVAQGYHLSRPVPAEAFDVWRAGRARATTGAAARVPVQGTARTEGDDSAEFLAR